MPSKTKHSFLRLPFPTQSATQCLLPHTQLYPNQGTRRPHISAHSRSLHSGDALHTKSAPLSWGNHVWNQNSKPRPTICSVRSNAPDSAFTPIPACRASIPLVLPPIISCYGLKCVSWKFTCWSPNPLHLRTWLHWDTGSLIKGWLGKSEVIRVGPSPTPPGVLRREEGHWDTGTQEKDHMSTQGKVSVYKPRKQV